MNVVVVDDEPIIRIGLRSMLDWDSAGLRLVGEAEDGEEAWALLEQLEVDLIITDLLMPRMDGLELLRRIRDQGKDVNTIVLSCMDDFAWVKEAMKLGAKDYILKPTMEPEQLLQIMVEAKRELLDRRTERERVERWRQELVQSKQVQLNARLRDYVLHGRNEPALERDLFGPGRRLRSMLLYRGAASQEQELDWEELGFCAVIRLDADRLVLLHEEPDGRSGVINLAALEAKATALLHSRPTVARAAQSDTTAQDDPEAGFVGLGLVLSRMIELNAALEWHERQREAWFYGPGEGRVVTAVPPAVAELPGPLPYGCRTDLFRAITHGNESGFLFQAQELGEQLALARRPIHEVAAFVAELFGWTVSYLREQGYAYAEGFERKYVQLNPLRGCGTMAQVQRLLTQAYEELVGMRQSSLEGPGSAKSPSPFVRKAIQFMRSQYHCNISTAHIAEHVKLSRSYLSDLYSKETGESLIETLTFIRMEEAKKRLRGSGLKVYEVAEAVGFPDSKTFVKAFKRIVGCTPKEYEMSNK